MLSSLEARWFFQGHIPANIYEWFMVQDSDKPEERIDYYLLFPLVETIGVKVRGGLDNKPGNFEIKARRGSSDLTWFSGKTIGRVDHWVKWSVNDTSLQMWLEGLSESEGWLQVEKKRWIKKYQFDVGILRQVTSKAYPAQGCNVEITELRASSQMFWTFGIEAFGISDELSTVISHTGKHLFVSDPPIEFTLERSYAYPTWISKFGKNSQP